MIKVNQAELELLQRQMIKEIKDVAITLLDREGYILSWNKGVEHINGYKENEILGHNFRVFYLPRDRQEGLPDKLMDLARKEGRAKHTGLRLRKDGTTFWESVLLTALHNDIGEVMGFTNLSRELRGNEIE